MKLLFVFVHTTLALFLSLSPTVHAFGESTTEKGGSPKENNAPKEKVEPAKLTDISKAELQAIQNRLEKLTHLEVKFEQLVYTPLRKKTISYSGDAQFSRPSMFRWNQQNPTLKQVIYDGKDLYMYFPSQNVAYKFSASGSQAREIEKLAEIVLSINSLLELYTLNESKYDSVNKIVYLNLAPKSKGEIDGVKVEVNALKDFIKLVELTYSDGKVITYHFTQPKRKVVDKKKYTFVKPKGVKLEVFD